MEDVTRACRDLNKLSEKGKVAFGLFLKECERRGLNVLVTETYRTQSRQEYLYSLGRTRQGKIVTYVKTTGYHGKGNAIDICKNIKGHEYDDANFFRQCYEIAKELGIEWGGTCFGSFKDTPHFQIEDNWKLPNHKLTTTKVDEELAKAVSNIIKSGIKLEFNSWKRKDLISKNIKNVPILLDRLGGLDELVKDGIISDKTLWQQKKYNENHIRSLLIKFASKLK